MDLRAAWDIVSEYYEAVGVIAREEEREFALTYFADGAGIWLAMSGGVAVGCIALRELEGGQAPARSGEIKRLYVKPGWRRHGLAQRLLNALEDYAASRGYCWLYLDSKDDLRDAIAFYRARGYEDCARYNDNPQATVFLRRELR